VLEFGHMAITDAGLAHLKELKGLQYLDVSTTEVTDAGVLQLVSLKQLRVLLVPKRISEQTRDRLRAAIPGLRFEGKPEDVLK